MMRKMLFVLLLGIIITTAAILYMKQPVETITIGEYEASQQIDVTLDVLNISIDSSPDDKIHVQMKGHKVSADMLTIIEENNRFVITEQQHKKKWHENIKLRPTTTIIVQLPKSQSKTMTLNNVDGDCTIQNLTLDTLQLNAISGNANIKNMSISYSELHAKDGNVAINKSAIEDLSITARSGDVAIRESTGVDHTIQTTDGQIKLIEATEQPNIQLESISGDINIQYKQPPTSLQLMTDGEDINVSLPKYNKTTNLIGDGANILSAETKSGSIVIK